MYSARLNEIDKLTQLSGLQADHSYIQKLAKDKSIISLSDVQNAPNIIRQVELTVRVHYSVLKVHSRVF